jgi:site-specific DNA-methyltransferase (adenine-specific)
MELNKIYNEDCHTTLLRLKDGSIDLLLQDTPFGVTQNDWDIKPELAKMWLQWERVIKENGAMIFFATQPFASELILSNPDNFRYDIIWYKALGTGHLNANKMPMRNHEHILVFYKKLPTYNPQMGVGLRKKGVRKADRNGSNYGKFAVNKDDYYDDEGKRYPQSVLDFSNGDRTHENDHPTQKPLDLIRYLVKSFSNEGDVVFDGYMGSGTTAIACIDENRNYIGSELKTDYFDIIHKRIKENAPKLQFNE